MGQFSKFPDKIDTSTELPRATDNITPIKAELYNRLRDAILAIENELGVQPKGQVYSSVSERLNALETGITSGRIATTTSIAVKNHGEDFCENTFTLDFSDNLTLSHVVKGLVKVGIDKAIVRVFRDAPAYQGAATGYQQAVHWSQSSPLLKSVCAGLMEDKIRVSPTKSGTYHICGQLTVKHVSGNIETLTVNVLKNDKVVHTVSNSNQWEIGASRTFQFSTYVDLEAYDKIHVTWGHKGSEGSGTTLEFGDNLSWLSLVKIC